MAEFSAMRNNALPYPVYGLPFVVQVPLLDADGDPIAPSSPDSEISKNGDTAADCTNELVEISGITGGCYLSLTGTELTADAVYLECASTGAKTTHMTLYPRKLVAVRSGTCQGGSSTTIQFDASASSVDDYYNGMAVAAVLDSTTEVRLITDYNGSTKTATVHVAWISGDPGPDSNDTFTIYLPEGRHIQEANVTAIGGDTQSATDLKDFADAGYDPSTNKVQGVVLTDTLTTYTGNTVQTGDSYAIVNSGAHGNAALKTLIDAVDTVVDAILVDTAEIGAAGAGLTVLATAANLSTVAGYLDTEIAAILADTNELQTDWANGGRLDVILDARASQSSVDDIPTNAELATALGTADDAVLSAIAALSIPTAAQNAAALLDLSNGVETGLTPRQAFRLMVAAAAGKLSGAATTTIVIRNAAADSKDRITATVDADGNRSSVTLDLT